MDGTLYIAASAALDHQRRLEVITNNLANVNTDGFKADGLAFRLDTGNRDQADGTTQEAAAIKPNQAIPQYNDYMPATMKLTGYTDFSDGPARQTGNPLDVALEGRGFFSVRTPGGVNYTRQGSFALNQEGALVTSDGYPVMGEGGELVIEGENVAIDEEGYVSVDGNEVGRLRIVTFTNLNGLVKVGSSLFKPSSPNTVPQSAENTIVKQGYVESSNVNAIRMMTDMIAEMRMVEAYQKMIRTADTANTKAINELGRIV